MDFTLRGKITHRINNAKRESKNGKLYSWDYMVLEYEGVDFFGKQKTMQYPIKIWNDNKEAPYKGDVEIGDVVEIRVNLECNAWNGDVQIREFTNKDNFTQKAPSLFIDLMCMDITNHIKGKVAENLDFEKSISEKGGDDILDDSEDDLPF